TEVDIFVGQNYIVSLHPGHVPALSEAMRRWENTTAVARDRVGFLAHIVVDAIVDAYFPVTDNIDERLDRLESNIFRGGSSGNPEELLALKRSVFALRKAIYPLKDAFNTFPRREHALFDLETHPHFQDVYDHILRLLDIVDIQRDMITDAMDAHLAFVSNSLNETMKTLTVLGICVAIAGAVFGAWGMNVRGVPFAFTSVHGVYVGFWLVCLLTVALMALGLLWARRRGAL
ncbi:MAG: magnesium transporter CorA family protein, partial [Chloroflexi bacterium]|nr:magnesium transporter CorA family protein [Chloroflexota bacterium]